ncbi:MAG: hypothetical protein ACYC7E_13980 [Armatimonadota bacterium]
MDGQFGRLGALALMLVGGLLTAYAGEQAVTFRFNPPHGLTFTQTARLTRVITRDGRARREALRVVRVGTFTHAASGFRLALVPRLAASAPAVTALEIAQRDIPLTYQFDGRGRLVRLEGYDRLAAYLRKSRPADAGRLLADLPERTLFEIERQAWQCRIGLLAGGTYKLGDQLTMPVCVPLPAGSSLDYTMTLHLVERVSWQGRAAVRIAITQQSIPPAAQQKPGARNSGASPYPTPAAPLLFGAGERLLDPETMLILRERFTRDITTGAPPHRTTIRETSEVTYDYPLYQQ